MKRRRSILTFGNERSNDVKAGLDGPSKTIIVEPVEEPLYVPEEAPVEEPVKA
jgi:hypothetical protein